MEIQFTKYHGTGNDFIMIDNRDFNFIAEDRKLIEKLCHRRFGIGADGLILLQNHPDFDFQMRYFNSDGGESTMCGNGGRCTTAFAKQLNLFSGESTCFMSIDGLHCAEIIGEEIRLKMSNVSKINEMKDFYFIDTGSPHVVVFRDSIAEINVCEEGRKIRYNKNIAVHGTNVNFVQIIENNHLKIRTYERGVEDETWSCGTGSVAAAIAAFHQSGEVTKSDSFILHAPGGVLKVEFTEIDGNFINIFLVGKAEKVFDGVICI